MTPAKIIDCFTFFNELDILEIRLNVLDKYVDNFVIVESNKTFQKKAKPFHFEENKARFEKFLHKITYVKQTEYNLTGTAFDMERQQRNWIVIGVASLKLPDTAIILISDVDEIPKPESFLFIDATKRNRLREKLYYYYLNSYDSAVGVGGCTNSTIAVPMSMLRGNSPHTLRDKPDLFPDTNLIENAGWHFSYCGGVDKIITKICSFAHNELNTPYYTDKSRLTEAIKNNKDIFDRPTVFEIVPIDESYPEYIQKNQHLYPHLIKC